MFSSYYMIYFVVIVCHSLSMLLDLEIERNIAIQVSFDTIVIQWNLFHREQKSARLMEVFALQRLFFRDYNQKTTKLVRFIEIVHFMAYPFIEIPLYFKAAT